MAINAFLPNLSINPTPKPPSTMGSSVQSQQSAFDDEKVPLSNPNFRFTAKTSPLSENPSNKNYDPRILRGYIRRTRTDAADPNSASRLYFMYNPTQIQRSYIAYLDQQALDPNNTTFGSGNLAAAPGILDFTFELFFDRQIEVGANSPGAGITQDLMDRGVLVDYDFFDRVVRGVNPDNPGENKIPDNGVMMINPNNITVVFSQELAVTGRPYNATVSFEKFSHRMVPTRMRIGIQMKVVYIGPTFPPNDLTDLSSEQVYQSTVAYENSITVKSTINTSLDSLSLESDVAAAQAAASKSSSQASPGTSLATPGSGGPVPPGIPPGPYRARIVRRGFSVVSSDVPAVPINPVDLIKLIISAGIPMGEAAVFAWAVSKRESNHIINIAGVDNGGATGVGLWQITDTWPARGKTLDEACDPVWNASELYRMSAGGTAFIPWQTSGNYRTKDGSHLYKVNMEEAYAFFRANGYRV